MRRIDKTSSPSGPLRKVAAALLARPSPCAWIDASDSGVSFAASAGIVTSRVRDGLILRLVAKRHPRRATDAGAR